MNWNVLQNLSTHSQNRFQLLNIQKLSDLKSIGISFLSSLSLLSGSSGPCSGAICDLFSCSRAKCHVLAPIPERLRFVGRDGRDLRCASKCRTMGGRLGDPVHLDKGRERGK